MGTATRVLFGSSWRKDCGRCKKTIIVSFECELKDYFHKDQSRKDGLSCYCKTCHKEHDRKRRSKNGSKNIQTQPLY